MSNHISVDTTIYKSISTMCKKKKLYKKMRTAIKIGNSFFINLQIKTK